MEHRAAAVARESVTRAPHHVDVAGPLRDAFIEDAQALVEQWIEAALEDLRVRMCAQHDAELRSLVPQQRERFRIVLPGAVTFLVLVIALAALLTETPRRIHRDVG